MQSLVYQNPYSMGIEDRPMPTAEVGEVVLQIDAVGICGSDMHCFHGHDPRRKPGLVLGHEFAGTVVESKVDAYAIGDRVTGNPLITCGRCHYCLQARDNLCPNRTMVGMTCAGAHAQYMSIAASSLIPIPTDMLAIHAALTEPAATVLHAINACMKSTARPMQEGPVLVIGGGAIGFLSVLLLHHYGCSDVTIFEVNADRRRNIEGLVQVTTQDPTSEPVKDSSYACVIDAVGSAITRTTAIKAVTPGGVVVHVGLQDWESTIDMRRLTLAEITLIGVYTYSMSDLQATVRLLHQGAFGDLNWLETMPLSQGAEAFDALDKGKVASSKLVLLPQHTE